MPSVASRTDYFTAGLEVLATEGVAGLKIARLCSRLGVTSGSFYHHFGGWDGFVTALLHYWEETDATQIFRISRAVTDPRARVHELKHLASGGPHDAEAAIRAWARSNPAVAQVQRRVDEGRLAALTEIVLGVVGDPEVAARLAMMGMTLLIGAQQWRTPMDLQAWAQVLDEYEKVIWQHALATEPR